MTVGFDSNIYSGLQYKSADEINNIQTELLIKHIEYTVTRSPFYKKLFNENSINYQDINSIEDFRLLPFTDKVHMTDKRNNFLAVPEKKVVDICLTSGTTGSEPTVISQTQSDLKRLAYNEEVAFQMAGITEDDTLLICAAIERCFMAGLAYFLGGISLNSRVLRGGAGSAAQHWQLMKTVKTTVIIGVPSLMVKIAEYAVEAGEDPLKAGIKKLIAIGEPVRNKKLDLISVAKKLENYWGAEIYSTYASSELATTFCECSERQGGHLRPELIVVEIVDENNNPVEAGVEGEIVATPLGITGMPLVRFKTGDISFLINQECACGRKTSRLAPILGRKKQMLKYKGTTIFPNSIIESLEGRSWFYGGYVEAKLNSDGTDRIILHAAINDLSVSIDWIRDEIRSKVRVVPEIVLATEEDIDNKVYQFGKKRKRTTFFDLRETT